jgi:hypothetical protein
VIGLLDTHILLYWLNSDPRLSVAQAAVIQQANAEQLPESLPASLQEHRHRIAEHQHVVAHRILGGLHHEYGLEELAA